MNDHDIPVRNGVCEHAPPPMVPIPVLLPLVSPPPLESAPAPPRRPRRSRRRVLLIAFTLAALGLAAAIHWHARETRHGDLGAAPQAERAPSAEPAQRPASAATTSEEGPSPSAGGPPTKPKPKRPVQRPRCGIFGGDLCDRR